MLWRSGQQVATVRPLPASCPACAKRWRALWNRAMVTGPGSGEGLLKLHASVAQADPRLRIAAVGVSWSQRPPEKAVVFCLRIPTAVRRMGPQPRLDDSTPLDSARWLPPQHPPQSRVSGLAGALQPQPPNARSQVASLLQQ
jgi:hypothetical protein